MPKAVCIQQASFMPIIFALFCSLLLPFGCESSPTMEEVPDSEQYVKSVEEIERELMVKQMVEQWEMAMDPKLLLPIIEEELEAWQDSSLAKEFQITDYYYAEYPLNGVYQSPEDWHIEGQTEEYTFHIRMEDNQAILTYDEVEQKMSGEEMVFLLPATHVEVLYNIIKNEAYFISSWSPVENSSWKVQLFSDVVSLEEKFKSFIYGHYSEDDMPVQEQDISLLDSTYQLNYILHVEKDINSFTITSIQVMLEKQGLPMEHLIYSF